MGAPRKYKGAKLERACRDYIDSISYIEDITRAVPSGEYTEKGQPKFKYEPVLNARGEQLKKRVYISAPSLTGLALFLRLDRSTVTEYLTLKMREGATDEDKRMSRAVECVRAEIEQYNIEQLSGKGTRGAMFNLNCNFGWSETQNMNVSGAGTIEEYLREYDRRKKETEESEASGYEY